MDFSYEIGEVKPSPQHDADIKEAFVEWWSIPEGERKPPHLRTWAKMNGVPERTAWSWKRSNWFKERLELHYSQINVFPDRVQAVADAMHAAALTGNTKAAELYLRYVERISPQRVIVEDRRVEAMSDVELEAALKDAAEALAVPHDG